MRDQAMVCGITLLDFSSRFYLSRPSLFWVCAFFAVAGVTGSLAGCRGAVPVHPTEATAGVVAALARLPAEAEIVIALDLDRLRGQPVWKTLSPALARHAGPALDTIAAGMGIEPLRQFHRVWIGLPGERQADGRFVLVAETDGADAGRVTAWLRKTGRAGLSVAVPNPRQIVVSQGSWSQVVAALPGSGRLPRSAADNVELRRLCERAAGEHRAGERALWFAALVPLSIRRSVMEIARLSDVATLVRTSGFLDDGAGLHAELVGEFGNTADPPLLGHRLKIFQNQAKRNPGMLVAGLSPYLEAVHVDVREAQVRVALDLPDGQTGDVLERIEAGIEALARTPRTKYSPAP
jgi:hypothetical protein